MSAGDNPELTKSWVVVSTPAVPEDDTERVQNVETETLQDSDTDSISVISESGGSYRTDDEEISTGTTPIAETENKVEEPEPVPEPAEAEASDDNQTVEKLLYFATSAVCAVILIGFSVAVQQYLQGISDVNTFTPDKPYVAPHVQDVRKRKSDFPTSEQNNKIPKLGDYHTPQQIEDNDLRLDINTKSNYKPNRNKRAAAKCNKENCDVTGNRDDENEPNSKDETYNRKIDELKVMEDYLKEKEKFLIEKEHDLLKKEIKLNQEKEHYKKNKYDKREEHKNTRMNDNDNDAVADGKNRFKKPKHEKKKGESKRETEEAKNDYKHKHAEEKKQDKTSKRQKYVNEQQKKRNMSGQWYINLHEGRDNMRQKKRSIYRRNKAHWYFQWMVDRARLRVK